MDDAAGVVIGRYHRDDAPGVLAIERATWAAVPAPRLVFAGPFMARAFLGGTGRANAACSLGIPGEAVREADIAQVEAFYARLGQTSRFRATPLDPSGLRPLLQARGYHETELSQVICGPLAGFAHADASADILTGPEPAWMEVLGTAEHQVPARRAEKLGMKDLLGVPAAWVLLRVESAPAACAFVTADGPLAGLFDLAVRPEFRRRGLGRRVMAAAGAWAMGQGARFAYAQVSCANHPSLALNAGLGLREGYRYSYFVPG